MIDLPIVDRPTFDGIECNRCGACCEKFSLSTPDWSEGRLWWNYRGPLGWLELWAYREVRGQTIESAHGGPGGTNFAAMLFFGQLTATWTEETEEEHGGWFYSCGHFRRDEERLGVCGIHETRPKMCSEFPYDKPITEWDDCSWNIELVDFDVVQGVLLWN